MPMVRALPCSQRTLVYDGENRPLSVSQNGNVASFTYGPDGERAGKSYGAAVTSYLGQSMPSSGG